jgi:hypothetical protein
MLAHREPPPEYELPQLHPSEEETPARGIVWGVVIVVVGFWLPVASALYVWLG